MDDLIPDTPETHEKAPATPETPSESGGGGLDFIPEQYRETSWATKYDNSDDFFDGIEGMSKVIGQKEIVDGLKVPGEDATDEERTEFDTEFRKVMNVPEEAGGYEIPEMELPEGVEVKGEFNEAYKAAAHKYGMSPDQMAGLYQDMMPAFAQDAKDTENLTEEQVATKRTETAKTFQDELGDDTAQFFGNVKIGAEYADSLHEGLLDRLEKRGLADDPDILRLAGVAGALVPKEAQIKTPEGKGGDGGANITQVEARAKIIELKKAGEKENRAEIDKLLETHFPGKRETTSISVGVRN